MATHRVAGLVFGLADTKGQPSLYKLKDVQAFRHNKPTPLGVQSLFMGATRQYNCATCSRSFGETPDSCPGHAAQIDLNTVVYAPGLMKQILTVLKSVCFFCSRALSAKGPFGKKVCSYCNHVQPENWMVAYGTEIVPLWPFNKKKPSKRKRSAPKDVQTTTTCPSVADFSPVELREAMRRITPHVVNNIFSNIHADDLETLGYHNPSHSHPKNLIRSSVTVMPTKYRPLNLRPNVPKQGLHDLSTLYQSLLAATTSLAEVKNKLNVACMSCDTTQLDALTTTFSTPNSTTDQPDSSAPNSTTDKPNSTTDQPDSSAPNSTTDQPNNTTLLGPNTFDTNDTNTPPYATSSSIDTIIHSGNSINSSNIAALAHRALVLEADIQVLVCWLFNTDPRKTANRVRKSDLYPGQEPPVPSKSSLRHGGEGYTSILTLAVGPDKVHSIVRGHIGSKRCDKNARAVIAGDAFIDIDQVGVPEDIATSMTFPEVVTSFNMAWLKGMVENGARHPGATQVKTGNRTISLGAAPLEFRKTIVLKVGDIVMRHMIDNDLVALNRAPTLGLGSLMAHRAKIIKGSAFLISKEVVTSYNADFDGDEMNLHFPQTQLARAEYWALMSATHHILPMQTFVQDSILAAYMLTSHDALFNLEQASPYFVLLNTAPREPTIWVKNVSTFSSISSSFISSSSSCWSSPDSSCATLNDFEPYWTGKDLVGLVLPDVYFDQAHPDCMAASMSKNVVPHVLIRNGQLLTGRLDKQSLAKLLKTTCLTTKFGATFMSNMTRLTSLFINSRPVSMGPSDMRAADKVHRRVKYLVGYATDMVAKYAPQLSNDDLHSALGLVYNVAESVMRFAVETREAERDMLQLFTDDAGCKGTFHNKVQVQASHGVALMKGELILNTDPSTTRVLPCFPPNTSRSDLCQFGVIRESLSQGVPAKAAMFTFCQGRVGLVDTAITTSKSGYTGNRIGVNMTCRVVYGNLVLSNHVVVMNIYYGDGYDPVRTVEKKAAFLLWSPQQLEASLQDSVLPTDFRDMTVQLAKQVSDTKLLAFEFSDVLDLPYDLENIFLKTYYSMPNLRFVPSPDQTNLAASFAKLSKLFGNFAKWTSQEAVKPVVLHDLVVLDKLLRDKRYLCAFCDVSFINKLLDLMESLFAQALYSPGSQCGRIASMGMSSKIMQVVLNSHRTSGATNTGGGLVRFDSILSVAPAHPSVASMCIECDSEIEASLLAKSLPLKTLHNVVLSASYEPSSANAAQDAETLRISDALLVLKQSKLAFLSTNKSLLGFVWRIVVDKEACLACNIKLGSIAATLQNKLDGLLASSNAPKSHVARSRSDAPTWVLRILLAHNAETNLLKTKKKLANLYSSDLCSVKCGGLPRVFGANPVRRTTHIRMQDDSIAEKETWFVVTSGTNLKAAMQVVDPLKVSSNCIRDTEQALGVFAAQRVFFTELKTVMGSNVQDRHVFLLSQTILMSGRLCGVNRHGFARSGQPIAQICFENARKAVVDLAHSAARDDCQDDTAAAVLGRTSRAGTGSVVLLAPSAPPTTNKQPKRKFVAINCQTGSFFEQVKRMRGMSRATLRQQAQTNQQNFNATFLLDNLDNLDKTTKSPNYQAESPNYRVESPNYRVESPNYRVESPNYRVESPNYRAESPNYRAESPNYRVESPNYQVESPNYRVESPNYRVESPNYQVESPNYQVESPNYRVESPNYRVESPNYRVESPNYQVESPPQFKDAGLEYTTDMLLDRYANDVLSAAQTVSGQVPKAVIGAYIPQEQHHAPSVNWDW